MLCPWEHKTDENFERIWSDSKLIDRLAKTRRHILKLVKLPEHFRTQWNHVTYGSTHKHRQTVSYASWHESVSAWAPLSYKLWKSRIFLSKLAVYVRQRPIEISKIIFTILKPFTVIPIQIIHVQVYTSDLPSHVWLDDKYIARVTLRRNNIDHNET